MAEGYWPAIYDPTTTDTYIKLVHSATVYVQIDMYDCVLE